MIEKMQVYRENGKIVHIGEWNATEVDGNGNTIQMPVPDSFVSSIEDVEKMPNGARVAVSDYSTRRAAAYPSLKDQLDYIYHNGIEAWKTNMIEPIKTNIPKV